MSDLEDICHAAAVAISRPGAAVDLVGARITARRASAHQRKTRSFLVEKLVETDQTMELAFERVCSPIELDRRVARSRDER